MLIDWLYVPQFVCLYVQGEEPGSWISATVVVLQPIVLGNPVALSAGREKGMSPIILLNWTYPLSEKPKGSKGASRGQCPRPLVEVVALINEGVESHACVSASARC